MATSYRGFPGASHCRIRLQWRLKDEEKFVTFELGARPSFRTILFSYISPLHLLPGPPALDGANIRRALASALKGSEIQDFHFHDLRHTCATRMVQAGVDLYKVQRISGHKSPIMTQRYAHHYPESLRDGVKALEVRRTVSTNLAQSKSCPEPSLVSY